MASSSLLFATFVCMFIVLQTLVEAQLMLDNFMDRFRQNYARVGPADLMVAEKFATLVGNHRLYHFTLRTWKNEPVPYAQIEKFLKQFGDHFVLSYTTDSDAATELLAYVIGTDALKQLKNEEQTLELLKRVPGQQCARYIQALGESLFETDQFKQYVNSELLFGKELEQVGHMDQVKQFLLGWAHYQICRSLVLNDHKKLVHKFFVRLQDQLESHPQFPKQPLDADNLARAFAQSSGV